MTFTIATTLAKFKLYIRATGGSADYDTFLTECLQAATDRCFNYMQQDYSPGLVQQIAFIGNGRKYIDVPWMIAGGLNSAALFYTLTAVTEQELGSSTAASGLAVGTYRHQLGTRRIYNDNLWSDNKLYRVDYTNPALVVPQQIKEAVLQLAAHYWMQSRQGFGSLGHATDYSNVEGTSQVRYIDPEERILRILDPYKYYPA